MRKQIDKILEYILIGLMGVMVINVVWQVFSRYVLQDSSSFTEAKQVLGDDYSYGELRMVLSHIKWEESKV